MGAGRKSLLRIGRAFVLVVLTGATTLFSFQYSASQELPTRMKIRLCYRAGATNVDLMQQCTGLNVPPVVFDSCMRGGTCFSEPPVDGSPAYPPGYPFCGAPGLPACPSPAPCGYGNTIPCPPYSPSQFCGAPGHPSCNAPQACGQIHTLQCQPIGPVTTGDPFALGRLRPSWRVGLPGPDRTPQNLQDLEALGVRGWSLLRYPSRCRRRWIPVAIALVLLKGFSGASSKKGSRKSTELPVTVEGPTHPMLELRCSAVPVEKISNKDIDSSRTSSAVSTQAGDLNMKLLTASGISS